MAGGRKKKRREAWNRFADSGRLVLVGSATLLPLRRSAMAARLGAAACLVSIKILAKALKKVVPERRPDGEDDKSFPSEHAAECVAAAMIISREYGGSTAAIASGLAGAVCVARVESKKHHPRDVLAGALIGCGAVWASLQLRLAVEGRLLKQLPRRDLARPSVLPESARRPRLDAATSRSRAIHDVHSRGAEPAAATGRRQAKAVLDELAPAERLRRA